jgi:hypothetical protein
MIRHSSPVCMKMLGKISLVSGYWTNEVLSVCMERIKNADYWVSGITVVNLLLANYWKVTGDLL